MGIVSAIIFAVIYFSILSTLLRKTSKRNREMPTISDDGHVVPASQDMTCETQYGHHHEPVKRYIVHDEPMEGYIVLNGKRIHKKDLKNK